MKLYYHKTDGGAEYYSLTFIECGDGTKEGTMPGVILRTDGNEIEIYTKNLEKFGVKLVIN